jgi:hypothetical protein
MGQATSYHLLKTRIEKRREVVERKIMFEGTEIEGN